MIESLWSVLILICIGLACAHIVSAIRTQTSQGESVIKRTYTANPSIASEPQSSASSNQENSNA
jgi:hypothetical protein